MVLYSGQNALSSAAAEQLTATSVQLAELEIKNLDGSIKVYVGPVGVASNTGHELAGGATLRLSQVDPSKVYLIAASSTPTVSWVGHN